MKKKYILPSTCIVDVELHLLQNASLDPNKSGNQTVTVTNEEVGEFTSRRSVWGDEDDEDDEDF